MYIYPLSNSAPNRCCVVRLSGQFFSESQGPRFVGRRTIACRDAEGGPIDRIPRVKLPAKFAAGVVTDGAHERKTCRIPVALFAS